ncbi:L-seryl-tRNA(Sec) selenium transferase [Brassicibacter mesophilus]|uniref:L-seryl-tRNA(Sec) selenium transferase n=1 Tax=Brassicibacter mesophilus TaxID=745119 RepID=UPI003D231A86
MKNSINLFSRLPKVDQLLSEQKISHLLETMPREIVLESIREEIERLRNLISQGSITLDEIDNEIQTISELIEIRVQGKLKPRLRKVINGTGVVIHTNLGRSLISNKIINNVVEIASSYNNLEFDLEKGSRGSRYSHLEDIIKRITGAEAALVVNNNAAAVMLVLSSLAENKEVIVSRGELVEIGGSFRVPDVMEQSGAKLVDVGTTNKTHYWDYEKAIGEDTSALLKVHTSNYRILGFTSNVSLEEMVELGAKYNVPVVEDLGSGVLIDLSKYGLEYEPTVQESIKAGVDVVTFSGDKLLGGPQAGIIIGKKKYIDIMKKHPLNRALRIDKFTISALEATLKLYLDEKEALEDIPTLKMLTTPIEELNQKALLLQNRLFDSINDVLKIEVVDDFSQVGGGSMPLEQIPTKCVMIYSNEASVSMVERKLRQLPTPIITRLYKDRIFIDMRTVDIAEIDTIVSGFKHLVDNI